MHATHLTLITGAVCGHMSCAAVPGKLKAVHKRSATANLPLAQGKASPGPMAEAEGERVSHKMADPLDTDDSAAPPAWVARESRDGPGQLSWPFPALPGASRSSQAWPGSTVMCIYNHSDAARSVSAVAKVVPRVKTSNDPPSCEDAGSVADKSEGVGASAGNKRRGKRSEKALRDVGEDQKITKKLKMRAKGLREHYALCKAVIPVTLILMRCDCAVIIVSLCSTSLILMVACQVPARWNGRPMGSMVSSTRRWTGGLMGGSMCPLP